MAGPEAFDVFCNRLRQGDDHAAREVFERFAGRLVALARRQFDGRLLSRADPEDVVQSVFKSFFVRFAGGRFRVADWEGLWALLVLMTVRKSLKRARFLCAARRDARRDVARNGWEFSDLASRAPSPFEAAALVDLIARLLAGLPREEQEIISLHLAGYSIDEISDRCRRAGRTVRRIIARGRNRLLELTGDGSEGDS